MNRFQVLYWVGSAVTDCYIDANDSEEARKKFAEKRNGHDDNIIKIKEIVPEKSNKNNQIH